MKTTLIVIQNDSDHAQAKALIEKLMNSKDPDDRARMMAQAQLTEAYERSRWPRRAPSLPDLLTCLTDQHGLSRADSTPLLGTASRVSEVLTGERELSMTMVRKLREQFHIPADLLIPRLVPTEKSPDERRHRSQSAGWDLAAEERERKVTTLRHALIEGENSGEAEEIDIKKIKAKARQRSGS